MVSLEKELLYYLLDNRVFGNTVKRVREISDYLEVENKELIELIENTYLPLNKVGNGRYAMIYLTDYREAKEILKNSEIDHTWV